MNIHAQAHGNFTILCKLLLSAHAQIVTVNWLIDPPTNANARHYPSPIPKPNSTLNPNSKLTLN